MDEDVDEATASRSGVMERSEKLQRGRKHIFAVNGSPIFLDAIRMLFQSESYNVTTTNFVAETFDQVTASGPDLVVIDRAIYQQAGWDLLERLRADERTREIPVVVVSTDKAYLEEVQANPERYGGQRFLTKPFDIDDMFRAIDELIGAA